MFLPIRVINHKISKSPNASCGVKGLFHPPSGNKGLISFICYDKVMWDLLWGIGRGAAPTVTGNMWRH